MYLLSKFSQPFEILYLGLKAQSLRFLLVIENQIIFYWIGFKLTLHTSETGAELISFNALSLKQNTEELRSSVAWRGQLIYLISQSYCRAFVRSGIGIKKSFQTSTSLQPDAVSQFLILLSSRLPLSPFLWCQKWGRQETKKQVGFTRREQQKETWRREGRHNNSWSK